MADEALQALYESMGTFRLPSEAPEAVLGNLRKLGWEIVRTEAAEARLAAIEAVVGPAKEACASLPAGPFRMSPWHVEEGEPAVRCAEGWIVSTTSSDAHATAIVGRREVIDLATRRANCAALRARATTDDERWICDEFVRLFDRIEELEKKLCKQAGEFMLRDAHHQPWHARKAFADRLLARSLQLPEEASR